MWRKLIKYRDLAKQFYKVNIGNGNSTSFLFDNWCGLGCLHDLTGSRYNIDLGITSLAMVASEKANRCRRNHWNDTYGHIEDEIHKVYLRNDEDVSLWRSFNNKYKANFNTKVTKGLVRNSLPCKDWCNGVWFANATPKYSFTWLAMINRLATGDRKQNWTSTQRTDCIFCGNANKSCDHLFFSCRSLSQVWKNQVGKLLGASFSTQWNQLVNLLNIYVDNWTFQFIYRYVFQASLYDIWGEQNKRRHGEALTHSTSLAKVIDKQVRNRFSSIWNQGHYTYDDGLTLWFSTRPA